MALQMKPYSHVMPPAEGVYWFVVEPQASDSDSSSHRLCLSQLTQSYDDDSIVSFWSVDPSFSAVSDCDLVRWYMPVERPLPPNPDDLGDWVVFNDGDVCKGWYWLSVVYDNLATPFTVLAYTDGGESPEFISTQDGEWFLGYLDTSETTGHTIKHWQKFIEPSLPPVLAESTIPRSISSISGAPVAG